MQIHHQIRLASRLARILLTVTILLAAFVVAEGQTPASAIVGTSKASLNPAAIEQSNQEIVPTLVPFEGTLASRAGQRVSVHFSIFAAASSSQALWSEDQAIQVGAKGEYSVLLGAGSSIGLPHALFANGEPRWLAVEVRGDGEAQERTLLTSVPYAMKSASADTLGGQPVGAFVTQDQLEAKMNAAAKELAARAVQPLSTPSGSGKTGTFALWSSSSKLTNSAVTQTGSGSSAKIGIGTSSPATSLDVNGPSTFRGETSMNASSTDWMLVVTNTSSTAKGVLLAQAQGNNLSIEGASPGGIGVEGATNTGYGVEGSATTGLGGYFHNNSASDAALAGENATTSYSGIGVYGLSANGDAVYGISTNGAGVFGTTSTGNGVSGTSTSGNGVNGSSSSAYGVLGFSKNSFGVAGESQSNNGVYGDSSSGNGVYGTSSSSSGVVGYTPTTSKGSAVVAQVGVGNSWTGSPIGDSALAADAQGYADGVIGFTDSGIGSLSGTNTTSEPALAAENNATGTYHTLFGTFLATGPGGSCGFGSGGDLSCTGQVKSLVTTASARQLQTYSVQSSENWLEDYGSGQLVNGKATIHLDAAFVDAANTGMAYHVFLTPKGDAQTLYLAAETDAGFEVRESGNGGHTIGFDYRIVAKRRGLETQRLIDITDRLKTEASTVHQRTHSLRAGPQTQSK